jgi:glycosyltransferase involved in cell wall biosynthesis
MPEVYDAVAHSDIDLTVLLPAFNEQEAIEEVVSDTRSALRDWPGLWEILVIDDASTDATAARAEAAGVRVIRRPERGGSGASRKAGTRAARGRTIAMMDADGSYDPSALPGMLQFLPAFAQVNGARESEQGTMKLLRFVAKLVIRKMAELISGRRIPDLNTGMKVYDRDLMMRYLWCIPDGFSCVSSMTLAFLTNGHPVKYVNVRYRKRIGQSKFHPMRDAVNYAATVVRLVMYFRPLRVFVPLSLLLAVCAVVHACVRWVLRGQANLADSDVILMVGAVVVLAIGLLADLIVAGRRR